MTTRVILALTSADADALYAYASAASESYDGSYGRLFRGLAETLGTSTAPTLTEGEVKELTEALRFYAETVAETGSLGYRSKTSRVGRIANKLRGLFKLPLVESGGEWW